MRITTSARIAVGVLALAMAVRPVAAQQERVNVPASVLERYVGEYVYPGGAPTVRVVIRGDTLFQAMSGQLLPLVPITETVFHAGPAFTAEFEIDRAGRVTQILTDGVDVEFRLTRKPVEGSARRPPPTPAPPRPEPAVRVPRSILERYVGVYEFVPGQINRTDLRILVRLRGDTLTRWMGQQEVVLTPVSETRFRVGSTSLMVEFVVDETGVMQVMGVGGQQKLARLTSALPPNLR